jgi:hypothetical protein
MKIKKINESIESYTEYELIINNIESYLKKGEVNQIIVGPENSISKTDITNIQKTYPNSHVYIKDGTWYLSVKENLNKDKFDYTNIVNKMEENYGWNDSTINIIDEFESSNYFNSPSNEDEYVNQFNKYMYDISTGVIEENKEEEIFSEDDDKYDEEELKRGTEIQKEHKPTYNKIKSYFELTGELPDENDVYKSISKDHQNEPDGVGELYYDDKVGLEKFEDDLKNEWKKRQEDDENSEEKNENIIIKFKDFKK